MLCSNTGRFCLFFLNTISTSDKQKRRPMFKVGDRFETLGFKTIYFQVDCSVQKM